MNRLYFGDNLGWLRDRHEFPDASVDLVYLDPPFNSNADYNVLFRETSGEMSQAQFHAFTDTWSWADAAETYHQFIDQCPNVAVVEMMEAFHSFLKNSLMMAYLAMMAPRLVELHRVLKETARLAPRLADGWRQAGGLFSAAARLTWNEDSLIMVKCERGTGRR
jgi:site-specific DNA-methyltransferase (adenine-specific)